MCTLGSVVEIRGNIQQYTSTQEQSLFIFLNIGQHCCYIYELPLAKGAPLAFVRQEGHMFELRHTHIGLHLLYI